MFCRFGYVECADREALEKIFSLVGTQLEGFSIQIQRSEAEKNRLAQQSVTSIFRSNLFPFQSISQGTAGRGGGSSATAITSK